MENIKFNLLTCLIISLTCTISLGRFISPLKYLGEKRLIYSWFKSVQVNNIFIHWGLYIDLFPPIVPLPTYSLCKSIDSLAVRICLVPDKAVREPGWSWELLLKHSALHSHHEVDPSQAEGHAGLGQDDLQNRFVGWSTWTQVNQV